MGVCLLLAMPLEGFAGKQDIEEVFDNATESYESEDYRADDEDSSCIIASALASLAECHTGEVNDIAPQRSKTPDYRMDDEDLFSVAAATLGGLVGCHNKEVHGIAPQRHEPGGYRSASMTGLRQCVKI